MKLMDAPWRRKAATAAFGFAVSSFPIPCASTILRRMGTLSFSHAAHAAAGYLSEGSAAGLSANSAWYHPPNGRKHGAANSWRRPAKRATSILRKPKTRRASVAGSCSTPIMEPWSKMFRSDTGQSQ